MAIYGEAIPTRSVEQSCRPQNTNLSPDTTEFPRFNNNIHVFKANSLVEAVAIAFKPPIKTLDIEKQMTIGLKTKTFHLKMMEQ